MTISLRFPRTKIDNPCLRLSGLAIALLMVLRVSAAEWPGSTQTDTATNVAKKAFWEKGVLGKLVNYFDKADDVKPLDKFDITFIGGPDVNSTTGVGLAICGSGLYHLQPSNPALQQSCITITAKATTKGMFSALFINDNFLPEDRFRSHASLELATFKSAFWGIGFDQNDKDGNECMYTRNKVEFEGNFMFRLVDNLYAGPVAYYNFLSADHRDALCDQLLGDRPRQEQGLSLGAGLSYDTRDLIHDAHRGMYLSFLQRFSPACFNTAGLFTTTELQVCGYQPAWRGCVIAGELHSVINCGHHVPWTQYPYVGTNYRMRGYYQGRYRDRNIIEAQVEFRQHLWKRFGMVWWAGAANSFRDAHGLHLRHTLPNYGLGLRWRFKPGVNVRFDYGFTRNGSGFVFCINEAF